MSEATIGAIDIGATKVLVALADRSGTLIEGRSRRFATPESAVELVQALARAMLELAPERPLEGIGCAVPGPLDLDRAVVLSFHNRGWHDLPLRDLLHDAFGVPVALDDDATAAALGEAVFGAGAGHDPVAYLTISSGVGAGLVIGGEPFRGAHGLAGEIGHLVLDAAGPPCGCGRHGDVEAYAGGTSIARRARDSAELSGHSESAQDVFAAAHSGDPIALALTAEAQQAIARVLAMLIAAFDPDRIVVGGSVALSQRDWIDGAVAAARELCHPDSAAAADVVPALLGAHSAVAGAALIGARAARRPRGMSALTARRARR